MRPVVVPLLRVTDGLRVIVELPVLPDKSDRFRKPLALDDRLNELDGLVDRVERSVVEGVVVEGVVRIVLDGVDLVADDGDDERRIIVGALRLTDEPEEPEELRNVLGLELLLGRIVAGPGTDVRGVVVRGVVVRGVVERNPDDVVRGALIDRDGVLLRRMVAGAVDRLTGDGLLDEDRVGLYDCL